MRPAGEIRAAIARAAGELACPGRNPTLQELAAAACVGYAAAMHTVKNMTRSGDLVVAGERKVDYRNKPVAEYAPATAPAAGDGFVDLGQLVAVWNR